MSCQKAQKRVLAEGGGHNTVSKKPKNVTDEQRLLHLAIRKIFEERGFYR